MKVGDLVKFSSHKPLGECSNPIGIVLRTKPDDGQAWVHWVDLAEASWEPIKWMEVISESR